MTTDRTPAAPLSGALRAARAARGWSQSEAARELAALGRARGAPVAAAASLKTLLSRWENGHAVPEPQYRALLGELLGRTPAELGIDGAAPESAEASGHAGRLRAAIAAATAVDDTALALWREQLEVARRLDDELGSAGAAGLVHAQVEQLGRTLAHTLAPHSRSAVAALLAEAALLAGAQALDLAEPAAAWAHYGRARAAAAEAWLPVATSAALAGLTSVLIEIGEPAAALALLGDAPPGGPPAARVRWLAAQGLASAAVGAEQAASDAFTAAEQTLNVTIDVGWATSATGTAPPRPAATDAAQDAWPELSSGFEVELADLHRWHGRALVSLGDVTAVEPLERALAAGPRSVRHRAALHADLAATLGPLRPEAAAEHARTARELALRIGSEQITARLGPPPIAAGSASRESRPS